MSLYLALILMLLTGLIGGVINYIMAKNANNETNSPNFLYSILIGIGATILVPLFLELAQSKLLDDMRPDWDLISKSSVQSVKIQSAGELNSEVEGNVMSRSSDEQPPMKTYLLFAAYCFLAAVAGPRFINSLIDGVLKEKEIERLTEEKNEIIEQKEVVEDKINRQEFVNSVLANQEEIDAFTTVDQSGGLENTTKPKIGPIMVKDDPQKGRFGGLRERNGRKLCANVKEHVTPGLYRIDLWVESTDLNLPLDSDVVYYLHHTFRPSVFTIKVEEFRDGKAIVEPKIAWGSFTVGVVTDNGNTLLEYDLSSDSSFPVDFRLK